MIRWWNGRFIICHVGTLQDRDDHIFRECLSDEFWYLPVYNIVKHKAITFMKEIADALVVFVTPQNNYITTPSKVYEYIAAAKPIIYILPDGTEVWDDGAQIVSHIKHGWVIQNNKEEITKVLSKLKEWAAIEHKRRITEWTLVDKCFWGKTYIT
jgi:hypothetical protein